ncbi:MAG: alpha/beta fold hydrolase [archaeon]
MAKKKKSNKEGLSTRTKIIIAVLIVLVIFFALDFTIKVNYSIRDDLQIELNPAQTIITSFIDETTPLGTTIGNKNFAACNTECRVILTDKLSNQIISDQKFELTPNSNKNLSFELPAHDKIGQKIFLLEATCQNIRNPLCQTDNKTKYRSSLITVNYEFSPDQSLDVNQLGNEIVRKAENINMAESQEKWISLQISEIKNHINTSLELVNETKDFSQAMKEIMLDFEYQDFYIAEEKLLDIPEINKTKTMNKIKTEIETYNKKIANIILINDSELNKAYEFYDRANNSEKLMTAYNKLVFSSFEEVVAANITDELRTIIDSYEAEKIIFEENLFAEIENYSITNNLTINPNESLCYNLNLTTIDSGYCDKIIFIPLHLSYTIINIVEETVPEEISALKVKDLCCINQGCDECVSQAVDYPILFVHGHSFNKKDPAETSISTFAGIQRKLDEEGLYINGGDIDFQTEGKGLWSRMLTPIAIRGTYYYLPYIEQGTWIKIVKKEEGIDTYAIRLKELIDLTLKNTNSDKVIIVAHSMGGLVSRNYMSIFGEEKVAKLIMIGTPNGGVSGRVENICGVFGDKKACEQMSEDNTFLKKLNSHELSIPTFTITGIGCDMNGENGDGVVTAESSTLSYAPNTYVSGVCKDTFKTELHSDLLNPDKYPETYELLKELLNK